MAFKTVFKKIRGRVIPIRVSNAGAPDEYQKVMHKQRAMAALKEPGEGAKDLYYGKFYQLAKKQSKEAGSKIGMRIAKLARRLPK